MCFLVCNIWCFAPSQMLPSWCGLRSCMPGFSVWRNMSSTQLWCLTPWRQKLELWARTTKSWTSSKPFHILSANLFTPIHHTFPSLLRGDMCCSLSVCSNIKTSWDAVPAHGCITSCRLCSKAQDKTKIHSLSCFLFPSHLHLVHQSVLYRCQSM